MRYATEFRVCAKLGNFFPVLVYCAINLLLKREFKHVRLGFVKIFLVILHP